MLLADITGHTREVSIINMKIKAKIKAKTKGKNCARIINFILLLIFDG